MVERSEKRNWGTEFNASLNHTVDPRESTALSTLIVSVGHMISKPVLPLRSGRFEVAQNNLLGVLRSHATSRMRLDRPLRQFRRALHGRPAPARPAPSLRKLRTPRPEECRDRGGTGTRPTLQGNTFFGRGLSEYLWECALGWTSTGEARGSPSSVSPRRARPPGRWGLRKRTHLPVLTLKTRQLNWDRGPPNHVDTPSFRCTRTDGRRTRGDGVP